MLKISHDEWSESKVLSLPVGEFTWLEFKGSQKADPDRLPGEMSSTFAAMANSGGGHIIFGVRNPQAGEPLKIDGGVDVTLKNGFKEWIEDIVPTLTDPPLTGFQVFEILSDGTTSSQIMPQKAVYVLEVDASKRPPHQALDNKYYIRSGSKNRPIGHQEVLSLMQWREAPQLELSHVGIRPYKHVNAVLAVKLTNIGSRRISSFQCDLFLPTIIQPLGSIHSKDAQLIKRGDLTWLKFAIRRTTPLFPQQDFAFTFQIKTGGSWQEAAVQNDSSHAEFTLWADDLFPANGSLPVAQVLMPRLDYQNTDDL